MSLRAITATFMCDRCGRNFSVDLDPAYKPPGYWSLYEVAEDKIRHSSDSKGNDCGILESEHRCFKCNNSHTRKPK